MTSDPGFPARQEVRAALHRLTEGPGDPVAELAALAWLRIAVDQSERDAVRKAREAGASWARIGEAMMFPSRPRLAVPSVAVRAFRRFAADLGDGLVFSWTCACGGLIADRGPDAGSPADSEEGHAPGCERFAATVAEWDEQFKDGSEEGEA